MTTREQVHRLVDALPENALAAAEQQLSALAATADPLLQAFLDAPEDDEPLTQEEIAAIEEGEADIAAGNVIPWETYLAQRHIAR